MRLRNISPLGDLIVTGVGLVLAGEEFDTDDASLADDQNFTAVVADKKAAKKVADPVEPEPVVGADSTEGNI